MLHQLPPAMAASEYNAQEKEIWMDVVQRTAMSKSLLTDSKPGMLDMMIESTNPEERGNHPEIGEEILALASALP